MKTIRSAMTRFVVATLAGLALLAPFNPTAAHGPLEEQIATVSQAILAHPQDAALYLQRGELRRLAHDWDGAQGDYDHASQLEPHRSETALCRAALALDRGDNAAALQELNAFLAEHPGHAEGFLLRSRAWRAASRLAEAVADLDRAIALLPNPRPEQYLERARLVAGANGMGVDAALRGLDAGIERLGPIVSLESYAIDLETAAGRPGAARARLTRIETPAAPQQSQRAAIVAASGTGAGIAVTTLTRAPYLQVGTPTSVVVRWRTALPSDSRIRYGDAPGSLGNSVDDPALVTEHELMLTALTSGTQYYYSVGTSTETLAGDDASHFVVTSPVPGERTPLRIWAIGDSGQPGSSQLAVRDAYSTYTGTRGTDVWLMLGDNAYNTGTDAEYQAGAFDPYKTMLGQCVLWPTRGNHDLVFAGANNDYYDIFTLPASGEAGGIASGTEAYYSFDHGNVHFVCLDSEGSSRLPTGAMAVWLCADLTANHRDWTIAYWHHPPYTKGSHDSDNNSDSGARMRDMRATFVPILDSLGVDLTLTGHSHSYERSFLLDRHYGVSTTLTPAMILNQGSGNPATDGAYAKATLGSAFHEGAVHVVAGSSSHTSGGLLNHPAMFTSMNILGSMVVDVDGPALTARFVDNAGAVRDYFSIVKTTATSTESDLRVDLRLAAAHPNPFMERTYLSYSLPAAGSVRLTVHDAAGHRVATIVDGHRPAGPHAVDWNGRDERGRRVAAGVYFARLQFAGASRLGKIVLSQ